MKTQTEISFMANQLPTTMATVTETEVERLHNTLSAFGARYD